MVQSHLGQIVHKALPQKTSLQRRAGGVAQGIGPEFKPWYHTKKKIKIKQKYGLLSSYCPVVRVLCVLLIQVLQHVLIYFQKLSFS
jgi:hypothetical protein